MSYYDGAKWVNSKSDVPQVEHWAILYFKSIFVPGDERSRTNPGHGYPEHYESAVEYVAFLKREDWEVQIQKDMASSSPRSFQALHVRPATVSARIEVKIT